MIKILKGTFEAGYGLIVWDINTDKIYHKVVDKNGFIEINGIEYKATDFVNGIYNESNVGTPDSYCPYIDNCKECPRWALCQKEDIEYLNS